MKDHNLHLTIYFIGNIENNDFDRTIQLLTPIINSTSKFSFHLEKTCFAPSQNPKMIWAKFYQNEIFTQLSQAIHKALEEVVQPTKFYYKEPVPHITLARFHPLKDLESLTLSTFIEKTNIPVTSIQLFESISTPTGVRYDNLGSFFYLSE